MRFHPAAGSLMTQPQCKGTGGGANRVQLSDIQDPSSLMQTGTCSGVPSGRWHLA